MKRALKLVWPFCLMIVLLITVLLLTGAAPQGEPPRATWTSHTEQHQDHQFIMFEYHHPGPGYMPGGVIHDPDCPNPRHKGQ